MGAVTSPDHSVTLALSVVDGSSSSKPMRRQYECSKCRKKFAKFITAEKHCLPFSWVCRDCGTNINKRGNVQRHIKRCAKRKLSAEISVAPTQVERSNVCSYCKLELKNMNSLRSHIYNMHKKSSGCFKCSRCIFSCDSERILKRHMTLKHSDATRINCTMCSHTCVSKSGMRRHMKRFHIEAASNVSESDSDLDPSDADND